MRALTNAQNLTPDRLIKTTQVFAYLCLSVIIYATQTPFSLEQITGWLRPYHHRAYDEAIRTAAVIRNDSPPPVRPLRTLTPLPKTDALCIGLDADCVELVAFKWEGWAATEVKDPLFLALEDEISKDCRGSSEPDLRIRQWLGLPPKAEDRAIYRVVVSVADLIRPCVVPTPLTETQCRLGHPQTQVALEKADLTPTANGGKSHVSVDYQTYMAAIYRWNNVRTGAVPDDKGAKSADPEVGTPYTGEGYPFTGLGWTYNWRPGAPDSMGSTEFVLVPGARLKINGDPVSVEKLCQSPAGSTAAQ